MRSDFITNSRRSTDLEAEAMINEGGAIRQPSMKDTEAVFERLNKPRICRSSLWSEVLYQPKNMFWAGFAMGFAIALFKNRPYEKA